MTPKDAFLHSLDDATALAKHLQTRIEEMRRQAESSEITWADASTAHVLAEELLGTAAGSEYDVDIPAEITRVRVLTEARTRHGAH